MSDQPTARKYLTSAESFMKAGVTQQAIACALVSIAASLAKPVFDAARCPSCGSQALIGGAKPGSAQCQTCGWEGML